MRLLPRFLVLTAFLPVLVRSLLAGTPSDPAIPIDLAALELPSLSRLITLRASSGYRDNVLLSSFAPEGRSFARAETEVVLSSLNESAWQWTAFLNGDVLRYFSPLPDARGEQQWFTHGELRWTPSSRLVTSLMAQVYYQDMVLDVSETEAVRVVAPIRVRGAIVASSTKIALPAGFVLEPYARVHRSDYLDYSGDFDETQAGLRLEWKHDERFVLSAGGRQLRRAYDERTNFTAGGRPLPDTHLRFDQTEAELKARSAWSWRGNWNASVAASRLQNRDQASGYFNYDRDRLKTQLGWSNSRWSVTGSGERQQSEYLVQTVGIGTSPAARVSRDTEVTARVERHFNPAWTAFAEARDERSTSNQVEFSYRARGVLGGVEFSF